VCVSKISTVERPKKLELGSEKGRGKGRIIGNTIAQFVERHYRCRNPRSRGGGAYRGGQKMG